MGIVAFLLHHGGVARTGELERVGFRRAALRAALLRGEVLKVRRGVYGLPNSPSPESTLASAVALGGKLTCLSAAPFYRLWMLNSTGSLHLCRSHPDGKAGVRDHGRPKYPLHPFLPVAGLADVLLHAIRCLPEADALVMVQCAVGRGDISLEFLYAGSAGRRNGRGRALLDLVIPRADSVLEVLANVHFARAGLRVRRHVLIPGVGEVDFLVEECLVVETDGATHFEPRAVKRDQRRNNRSMVGGYLVLRYYYADVVHHPAAMVAEVLAVLDVWRAGGRTNLRDF